MIRVNVRSRPSSLAENHGTSVGISVSVGVCRAGPSCHLGFTSEQGFVQGARSLVAVVCDAAHHTSRIYRIVCAGYGPGILRAVPLARTRRGRNRISGNLRIGNRYPGYPAENSSRAFQFLPIGRPLRRLDRLRFGFHGQRGAISRAGAARGSYLHSSDPADCELQANATHASRFELTPTRLNKARHCIGHNYSIYN